MKSERIREVYDKISECSISLAADPASYGARYLQEQTATCRNFLNVVTSILLEIHREKHNLANDLAGEETVYAIESDQLLSNDERVRKLPSIDDRHAAISVILHEHVARIAGIRRQIQDLDYVEKAVKHRHRELKDTMGEIKLQRSLLRDEIDTHSFYGDERTKGRMAPGMAEDVVGDKDDLNADEIASLMADEQASQDAAESAPAPVPELSPENTPSEPQPQVETPPQVVATPEDPPTDTAPGADAQLPFMDEQAIENFLAEGDESVPPQDKPAEDDFQDLFDQL
jgi:hypothetical protein